MKHDALKTMSDRLFDEARVLTRRIEIATKRADSLGEQANEEDEYGDLNGVLDRLMDLSTRAHRIQDDLETRRDALLKAAKAIEDATDVVDNNQQRRARRGVKTAC